jgi:hypothetical protein
MVQEVLARHPDVGFVSNVDSRFPRLKSRGRFNNSLYQLTPLKYTQRDRRRLLGQGEPGETHFGPSEAYRILEREVSPIMSARYRDLTGDDLTPWLERRLRRFFEERIKAQKKAVFLHKFTGWPRAGFLHRAFPQAKFLHVVRDGRAVANSLVQRPWWLGYSGPPNWGFGHLSEIDEKLWEQSGRDFIVLAGLEWKLLMEAFESARTSMPDDLWMQVRYEDFVGAPRENTERVLNFVGLPWSDEFAVKFDQFAFTKAKKDPHHRDLTGDQISSLDNVLSSSLRELGYETGTASGVTR